MFSDMMAGMEKAAKASALAMNREENARALFGRVDVIVALWFNQALFRCVQRWLQKTKRSILGARTVFQRRTRILRRDEKFVKEEIFRWWKQRHERCLNLLQASCRFLAVESVLKFHLAFNHWVRVVQVSHVAVQRLHKWRVYLDTMARATGFMTWKRFKEERIVAVRGLHRLWSNVLSPRALKWALVHWARITQITAAVTTVRMETIRDGIDRLVTHIARMNQIETTRCLMALVKIFCSWKMYAAQRLKGYYRFGSFLRSLDTARIENAFQLWRTPDPVAEACVHLADTCGRILRNQEAKILRNNLAISWRFWICTVLIQRQRRHVDSISLALEEHARDLTSHLGLALDVVQEKKETAINYGLAFDSERAQNRAKIERLEAMLNQTQGTLSSMLEAKAEKLAATQRVTGNALLRIASYVAWYRDRHWCTVAIEGWIIKLKQHCLIEHKHQISVMSRQLQRAKDIEKREEALAYMEKMQKRMARA